MQSELFTLFAQAVLPSPAMDGPLTRSPLILPLKVCFVHRFRRPEPRVLPWSSMDDTLTWLHLSDLHASEVLHGIRERARRDGHARANRLAFGGGV